MAVAPGHLLSLAQGGGEGSYAEAWRAAGLDALRPTGAIALAVDQAGAEDRTGGGAVLVRLSGRLAPLGFSALPGVQARYAEYPTDTDRATASIHTRV